MLARTTVLKYAFLAPTRREARTLARAALEWDLGILQHLSTPTTREMPRGYELYEGRGGRLPDYAYDDWLKHERLLLWMGVGGLADELVVRSMRLFAEEVAGRFR